MSSVKFSLRYLVFLNETVLDKEGRGERKGTAKANFS